MYTPLLDYETVFRAGINPGYGIDAALAAGPDGSYQNLRF